MSATPSSSDGYYNSGQVVTLTAAAALGFAFSHWTGDATGNANPVNITISEPGT